jgi:hypothetical protein
VERVTGIEPALSAWESVLLRPSTWPDLRVGVSGSDRERPLVAGVNCTLSQIATPARPDKEPVPSAWESWPLKGGWR